MGEIGAKGDDGSHGECTTQYHVPTQPEDEGGAQGAGQAQAHEEPAANQRLAHAGVAHPIGPFGKALHLVTLATEYLDQQRTAHVEGFVHLGVHFCIVGHLLASKETQTHPLHVPVQRLAQVADDPLADPGAKEALGDTDQADQNGDADDSQCQPVEARRVLVG